MLSHFTTHTSSTTSTVFRPRLRLFFPSTVQNIFKPHLKTPSFSTMETRAGLSVDSITDGLKQQSLSDEDKRVKLSLEDLNWDHSFVRELPGDTRTDVIPRQVNLFPPHYKILCLFVVLCLILRFTLIELSLINCI